MPGLIEGKRSARAAVWSASASMIRARAAAIVGFSASASRSAVERSIGYSPSGGGMTSRRRDRNVEIRLPRGGLHCRRAFHDLCRWAGRGALLGRTRGTSQRRISGRIDRFRRLKPGQSCLRRFCSSRSMRFARSRSRKKGRRSRRKRSIMNSRTGPSGRECSSVRCSRASDCPLRRTL